VAKSGGEVLPASETEEHASAPKLQEVDVHGRGRCWWDNGLASPIFVADGKRFMGGEAAKGVLMVAEKGVLVVLCGQGWGCLYQLSCWLV